MSCVQTFIFDINLILLFIKLQMEYFDNFDIDNELNMSSASQKLCCGGYEREVGAWVG